MIYGYLKNDKIYCDYNGFYINDDNYFLLIDGCDNEKDYYHIIYEYKESSIDFVDDIDDFISIYLYDKKEKKLFLINDRIGAKKIYYKEDDNILYFSNDLRLIKSNGSINTSVLPMYFRHHFIPEPYTIYDDIFKVEHGYYIKYDNNHISKTCYYNIIDIFNNRNVIKDYDEVEHKLEKMIDKKIKQLTNGKEDIGVYLSGGVDSSLVASRYSKISKSNLRSFSAGFDYDKYDESSIAKKNTKYLKGIHKSSIIKDSESLECVRKITDYYCEPFGDQSAIATIRLNEFAKENGIKYALTGDGADQLFCGANIYDTMYKIQKYSIVNPLSLKFKRLFSNNKYLFYLFGNIPKKYKAQSDIIFKEKNIADLFIDKGDKRFKQERKIQTNSLQEKRMILDLDTFMPERVFPKMCIAANKNDINILSPYLTKDVIELSFRIPHKYKYYKKTKKYLLRQLLYKNIPEEYFNKNKKGFDIPAVEWLETSLNDDLKRLSTKKYLKKQNIFNYNRVQYIINHISEYSNIVWDYYMFQLWYEKNVIK